MTASETPPSIPPLYGADSMLFIYHFENNQEFGEAAAHLLRRTESGRCRLVCTTLALLEVLVVPKRSGRVDLCQRYREVFDSFPNLRMQPVGEEIAEIASDLRARYNIKTPDAIHAAGAIAAGADAFISQDGNLKKIREIPVLSLHELS
jgi:predicted nucleic acid-binding protein